MTNGDTVICTNKPLHAVALDVWHQMDQTDRLQFLRRICRPDSVVQWIVGNGPERVVCRASADCYFDGLLA